MGYSIEGDSIVFTFHKKDYSFAVSHFDDQKIDLKDIKIENVVVAGSFNNWSRKQWVMKKINEETYQLKKKISDFDGDFNWEFKYVLNETNWAEPQYEAANIVPAKSMYGIRLGTYNYQIVPNYISENGQTIFYLKGYKDAKEVILSGSFNNWNETAYTMKRKDSVWSLNLDLPPNQYQYKFIVDGEWIEDPMNPLKVMNEYGGTNSVIEVKKEVTFILEDHLEAKEVLLSGTFNNWSESKPKMKKTEKGWLYTINLIGGKHHYKFIVDGTWILDPKNSVKEYDFDGNINSVIMVR